MTHIEAVIIERLRSGGPCSLEGSRRAAREKSQEGKR